MTIRMWRWAGPGDAARRSRADEPRLMWCSAARARQRREAGPGRGLVRMRRGLTGPPGGVAPVRGRRRRVGVVKPPRARGGCLGVARDTGR